MNVLNRAGHVDRFYPLGFLLGEGQISFAHPAVKFQIFILHPIAPTAPRIEFLLAGDRPFDPSLDVQIEELRQPHFAWTMEVRLVTSWSLKRSGEREPTWSDVIATSYAAPFPVEFFGIKRLRLANEGAARSNIEAAIVELADHLD